ncbi:hypothetical protein MJH12_12905, partial [bacterium]|nr:hypothetical protein [bacterium]
MNASGNVVSHSYYDAVAVIQGAANSYQVVEKGITDSNSYCFITNECINAPLHFGKLKNSYTGDISVDDSGLALSNTLGGFTVAGGGTAGSSSFAAIDDHFVKVVVHDLQNPTMNVPALNLTIDAGKSYNQDIQIGISDNNPYSHWLTPDGSNIQNEVPTLTQVLYQIGHDPKNRLGLGLLNENSYGFINAYRHIDPPASLLDRSDLEAGPSFNKDEEAAKIYPNKRNQGSDIERTDFHYPNDANENCSDRCDDRTINFQYFQQSLKYQAPDSMADPSNAGQIGAYWNKGAEQETLFPPLPEENYNGGVSSTALAIKNPNKSQDTNMSYKMLSTRFPSASNLFSFPMDDNNKNYLRFDNVQENNTDCLDGILPDLEVSSNCFRNTTWTLEQDTILAPYFFHSDVTSNYNLYAVGQDARLYGNYVATSAAQNISLNSYHYRLSGKTHTPYTYNPGLSSALLYYQDFQNKSFQVSPNNIGSIS